MDRRLATAIILLLTCAGALSLAAHLFMVFPFDLKITRELQEVQNPAFAAIMQGVSELGEPWFEAVLITIVSAIFVARRQWLEAAFVVATASSVVLTSAIKVLVGRPRPPLFPVNPADFFLAINRYSFPSGHVLFFVVFFGFIGYLAWVHLAGRTRMIVMAVCCALILLIAPSRVYLGAHWTSDVIGSYVIGVLWLIILVLAYQLAVHRRDIRAAENLQESRSQVTTLK
jgi:membrane-associated phospholipid phosphatase